MKLTQVYNKGKGEGIAFLRANISHSGDACLIWPLGTDEYGYGRFGFEGKVYKAHRWMCEAVHGVPPTPQHYAAHECGNGHIGCVHPQHLSWKTHAENTVDTIRHGRAKKLKGAPRRKLTFEQVQAIINLPVGMTITRICQEFGITYGCAVAIRRGINWKDRNNKLLSETVNHCQRNGRAKLTPAQVELIRVSNDDSGQLSQRYGVARSTINRIRNGDRWSMLEKTTAVLTSIGRTK